jgi:hypothetical protein
VSMLGSNPADVMTLDPWLVAKWWHEACAEVPSDVQVVVGRRAKLKWPDLPDEHIVILEAAASMVMYRITAHLQKAAAERLQKGGSPEGPSERGSVQGGPISTPPYIPDPISQAIDQGQHTQPPHTTTPQPMPMPTTHTTTPRLKPMRILVLFTIACCALVLLYILGAMAKGLALALLTVFAIVTAIFLLTSRP